MGEKEISEFLSDLAVKGNVAASTQNSPREIQINLNEGIFLCLYFSIAKNLKLLKNYLTG